MKNILITIILYYLVSCSHSPEVRNVCNGPYWESTVDKTVVYKHVGHPKHCNSKTLWKINKK
jgi:hypothetical protein